MAKMNVDLASMAAAFDAMRTVQEQTADALQRIAEKDSILLDAKNVKDNAETVARDLWRDVFEVARAVFNATTNCVDARDLVITAVMKKFLDVDNGAKKTTAGQYASTARKLLAHVTRHREDISAYSEMNRRQILDAMRDKSHAAMLEKVNDAVKKARFIIKHGDKEAQNMLETVLENIAIIYSPIKARRDGEKVAAVGARELADLRQRHPTAPATIETVVADITADDDIGNKAKARIALLEEMHAQKNAVM